MAATYYDENPTLINIPTNQNKDMNNQNTAAESRLPARNSKWFLVDCGETETWTVKSAGLDGICLTRWCPWDSKKLITVSDWNGRTKTQLASGSRGRNITHLESGDIVATPRSNNPGVLRSIWTLAKAANHIGGILWHAKWLIPLGYAGWALLSQLWVSYFGAK